MAYSDLSLKDRAQVIHMGVQAGLKNLKDIQSFYDSAVSRDNDYDLEAYYKEHPEHIFNHEGHYPDTYKKPNHPTFSDESIYHSEATPGGRWVGNTYEPSDYVLNQQGGWNNFLRNFQGQEQGTGAVPVFRGGAMLPEVEVHPQANGGSITSMKQAASSSSKLAAFTSTKLNPSLGHRFEEGGEMDALKLAKINDQYSRARVDEQKTWLQSWYDKRLPIIGKEGIKDYVTLGLQVPYYTPDSKELGLSDYQPSDTVYGEYLPVFFGEEYTPTSVLNDSKLRSNWNNVPGEIYFNSVAGTTPVHEFTHATQYGGLGTFNPQFTNGKEIQESQSYLQRPDEQHARIMELRYINKLTPEKTDYTLEEVQKLYQFSGERNVMQELHDGGMSDEDIMNALNTWASNRRSFDQGNGAYLAAEGGKIHIAPSKRGTFTAAATKHGKSVQAFASQVLANKENYSPAMVKKAVFAHNSKSWKHADGGYLVGKIYDVDEQEYNRLISAGYEIEVL